MENIPVDKNIDSTVALLREGYLFISNRRKHFQSDIFQTRLMFKKVICITGGDAVAIF